MQMVGNFRRFRFLPEETPFKETGIDLAVPNICKLVSQRIRLIKTGHGRHHVNDGLCAEPGDSSTSIVLKFVRYAAKDRPQQIAFPGKIFRPGRVWWYDGNMTELPPGLFPVVHSHSLAATGDASE